jgi:tetratricopeptide (TPR) repeat protein
MKLRGIFGLLMLVPFLSCTPKILENTVDATQPQEKVQKDPLCLTFSDLTNSQEIIQYHVLYRDHIRELKFLEAYPFWKKAYDAAPMADGRRNFHFTDGIKIYQHKAELAPTMEEKALLLDSLQQIFAHWKYCFQTEPKGVGQIAFEMYYGFREIFKDSLIFSTFKESIDATPDNIPYFVINPFTDLLIKAYIDTLVTREETQYYAQLLLQNVKEGVASGEDTEAWELIQGYTPQRLEIFEGLKGFYPCDYYIEKYYEKLYLANPEDCEIIQEVYSRLRWADCEEDSPAFKEVIQKREALNCVQETAPALSAVGQAIRDLREGKYQQALEGFSKAYEEETDEIKKSEYALLISKLYYGQLKNFPRSRSWALRAASHRPNWGEPYLLIGKLYASSGPLCGPGVGFDSQIVTWPAIDKWNYAKSIDASVAKEANDLIRTYSQYMPSVEDLFQRGIREGSPFKVECWIQENTTARPKR